METQSTSSAASSGNGIPYQPYRSKRHSRSASASINISVSPEPHQETSGVNGVINGRLDKPIDVLKPAPVVQVQRVVQVELTPPLNSPAIVERELASAPSANTPSTVIALSTVSPSTIAFSTVFPSAVSPSTTVPSTPPPSPAPRPSSMPTTPPIASSSKQPPSLSPTPTSTFRRIPPHTHSVPHTSPLRPKFGQSLAVSKPSTFHSPNSQSQVQILPPQNIQRPSPIQNAHTTISRAMPNAPQPDLSPLNGSARRTRILSLSSVNGTPSATTSAPVSISSMSLMSPPPHSSPVSSSVSAPRRPVAPYRPGFQPRGHYRHRTDEFIEARSTLRDKDKIEQRRLERRLEKLIALHFSSSPEKSTPSGSEKPKPSLPTARRASSFFDIGFSKNPSELWKGVVSGSGGKATVRVEEQKITPWEDDRNVIDCPLCVTSFHPLTNRKHHCRMCGRIVCSLPIKPPTRTQPCSILFVVDQKTGRIEEVGEGVDYGVKRKEGEEEKFLKGVRICRDCKVVLSRQQHLQDVRTTPIFMRLYETLVQLEKEIEETLPQFQELILTFSVTPAPDTLPLSPFSHALHKRLLESFASYDRLAKRIQQLPTPQGGSQERVQQAIAARAGVFLSGRMGILKAFPQNKPLATPSKTPASSIVSSETFSADTILAQTLQPLLEQESLLESFVEEAKAQRKFEDAKTLKTNLEEIRGEIARVVREVGG